MRLRALVVATSLALANLCVAAPRAVDAEQFDIAGVKLGMSSKTAAAAISEKLGIDSRAVEFDNMPALNPVTNSREPKYFTVKKDGVSIIVHFEPKLPLDPKNPMAVSMVIYEQPWTPDNVAAMKRMAIEKYGSPSNGVVGSSYQWCLKPHANPGFGCAEFQGPKLELSETKLQLGDFRYRQAVIDFMNKKQSSKPVF